MQASTKNRGYLTLLYVTALTFATLYAPQPLLSSIQAQYPGHSDATIALLMTVALVPLSFAPLIYGTFLSSLDTRRVLLVCIFFMAVGGLGLFFSSSFLALTTFRLMQGLVIPAVLTCLMAHISAKFHGTELQRALAIYIGSTIFGGLLGRTMAGCIATLFGWRSVFLVISIALIMALGPLWKLESRPQSGFARIRLREFAAILRTPGIPNLLLIDACGFFVFAAVANYLPFRLSEMGAGISEWRISLMYLGYGIGVLMAFGSRRIIAFMGGEVRAIAFGIGVYLCSLAGFLLESQAAIFMTMCMVCLGQFMAHSISPGLINRMATMDKGAVNGLYLSIYYLGGASGSYMPGLIYGQWGWTAFMGFLAVVLLVALLAIWGLERVTPQA